MESVLIPLRLLLKCKRKKAKMIAVEAIVVKACRSLNVSRHAELDQV
jgi:hypothetical protein